MDYNSGKLIEETYHSLILTSTLNDVKVVVKRCRDRADPRTTKRWQDEIDALKAVKQDEHNAHIAEFVSYDKDDLSITLRFETGKSLDKYVDHDMMSTLCLNDATTLLQQMAEALVHIHARQIAHDDVKPENIMWSDKDRHAVLIDFGAAYNRQIVGYNYFTMSGTPPYVPPEYLQRRKGPEADVWALGVTMLFAHRKTALPDGDWMLPGCFEESEYYEDGRHLRALHEWHEHIKDLRRAIMNEDEVVASMLTQDADERMSSFRSEFSTR